MKPGAAEAERSFGAIFRVVFVNQLIPFMIVQVDGVQVPLFIVPPHWAQGGVFVNAPFSNTKN